MAKILAATCQAGVVKVGNLSVGTATILSEGVASSEGTLILDGERRTYLAKTTPDLISTLEKIADALNEIGSALAALDLKPTGGVGAVPVPAVVANVAAISALRTQLTSLKEALR